MQRNIAMLVGFIFMFVSVTACNSTSSELPPTNTSTQEDQTVNVEQPSSTPTETQRFLPANREPITFVTLAKLIDQASVELTEEGYKNIAIAFDAQGEKVALIDQSGHVNIWELHDGKNILSLNTLPLGVTLPATGISFHPLNDSQFGVISRQWDEESSAFQGAVALVEMTPANVKTSFLVDGGNDFYNFAFSPDGSMLFAVSQAKQNNRGDVYAWDMQDKTLAWQVELNKRAFDVKTSPDGARLFIAVRGEVLILDAQTGEIREQWKIADQVLYEIAFNQAKGLMALRGDDSVYLVDTNSGEVLATLEQLAVVKNIDLNPMGTLLAVAKAHVLSIWDLSNPDYPKVDIPFAGNLLDVVFSPDGTLLATIRDTGRLDLWGIQQ